MFRNIPKDIYKVEEDDPISTNVKEIEFSDENKENQNKYNLADIPMDFLSDLSQVYTEDDVVPLQNDKIETPGLFFFYYLKFILLLDILHLFLFLQKILI